MSNDSTSVVSRGGAMLIGIVATALTLAVAELLAAAAAWASLVGAMAAPFEALAAAAIDLTPGGVKETAIHLFGHADKLALGIVIGIVLLTLGATVGLAARRVFAAGMLLALVLLAVAGAAVLTRAGSSVADLVPLAVGGAAGLAFLHRACRPRIDPYAELVVATGASAAAPVADRPAPTLVDRRRLFRVAGVGAGMAVVAGALSRVIPSAVNIEANRAAVRLPPVPAGGSAAGPSPTAASPIPGSAASTPSAPSSAIVPIAPPEPPPATVPPALPPGIDPAVPGLTRYVTPDGSFYRVDTAFTLPRVTTEAWKLTVHGMVRRPVTITWADLIALPQVERWVTLTCVSNEVGGNLVGNAAWQGVRIADLLARAEVLDGADCVFSTSADRFTVTTPLEALTDGRDALLAIGMNGQPLPIEHGFPARMVVPGLYGYVSATKWVVDMKVTRFADVTAFWTENGWAPRAPIKTASRIDTPGYDVAVGPGVVPVAGVAWAQHRGISAVQVQVDDNPWQQATLAGAASKDTWRQWVYRWDTRHATRGPHVLRCRAIDGTGAVQTAAVAPPAPNGASGYHTVPVQLR